MSSWHHGVPVLAYRAPKYDPEDAFRLMIKHGVRNTFMPPTALRLMCQVPAIPKRFALDLRTVTCAGEPMGAELLEWGRETFGVPPNEYYGQTECNLVVANCAALMEVKPGSMGRAVPGHYVKIIDEEGTILPPNAHGRIAVGRPDPVMFLEYWNDAEATRQKFIGDWLITGDQGGKDEEGYIWFLGRDDVVITSASYRIGPGKIEDCLGKHPAVSMAAVIGMPYKLRTEAVKAYILLRPGVVGDETLKNAIRAFVKTRLSPHEYPLLIEFVATLPMTESGKIRRIDLRNREAANLKDLHPPSNLIRGFSRPGSF